MSVHAAPEMQFACQFFATIQPFLDQPAHLLVLYWSSINYYVFGGIVINIHIM